MAILIPSKNIYEISNDKVLKNVIERIEVNATDIVPNNEFETPVYNEKFAPKDGGVRDNFDKDYKRVRRQISDPYGTVTLSTHYSCSYLYEEYYYHKATIKINRNLKNKYISKLYYGLEEIEGTTKERDFVKYSVSGTIKTTPIDITIHQRSSTTPNLEDSETTISKGTTKENFGYINIPKLPIEVTITNENHAPEIVSKVVGISDASNYLVVTENDDYYEISVEFLSSFYIRQAKGTHDVDYEPSNVDIVMSGEEIEAKATEITITAYGNTIGIDLQDKSITISEEGKENSKKVFSVENNELLQTSNYVRGTNANAIEVNYRNTLNAYKNGRETATLICDINEYKDTNGNLEISTKEQGLPMTFNVGDEVIPMVYGANGEDFPMSQKDGVPKVFVVSSVKPYYDGAVWQQIEIQEKTS
jgi:hypothetical protein